METVADRSEFLERMPRGGNAVEVGVFKGKFSQRILAETGPARLFLVDSWEADSRRPMFRRRYWRTVKRFLRDSRVCVLRMESVEAAALFPFGFFAWAYVDASHDYESVRDDLRAWGPRVAVGGFLAGHDYHREGVKRAVDEFVAARGLKIEVMSKKGRKRERNWPSYAIKMDPWPPPQVPQNRS